MSWARSALVWMRAACVYVDDLPFNLTPAAELGMATVHHTSADTTIPGLERLLGLALREPQPETAGEGLSLSLCSARPYSSLNSPANIREVRRL